MQCGAVARMQTYESEVWVLFLDVPEGFFYNYQHLYLSRFFSLFFCHIFGNSQERQEIILERGCCHPFWTVSWLGESSTSCLSSFRIWNIIIPFWILFIQLYPHRIMLSVNRYPAPWLEIQYLWRNLAKIQKIPNVPHAILLLHRQFGQNQSIIKPVRLQMRFF